MLSVILPDGSRKQFDRPVSAYDVAAEIGPGLAKAAVVAEVDGRAVDLHSPLPTSGEVKLRLLTKKDADALAVMRHSAAHVMAQAVMRLYEGVQLAFGPTTATRLLLRLRAAAADLRGRLSRRSKPRCRRSSRPTSGSSGSTCRATRRSSSAKSSARSSRSSTSRPGSRTSRTCRSTGRANSSTSAAASTFPAPATSARRSSCSSVAGAYWKGDASRQQLQRLYATAFFDKKELDAHLTQLEEAKRRDHRVLGKQLELFTISQTVGSGLILWLPKGAIIRQTLEDYLKDELRRRGYQPVYTPNIGKIELYQISGHFPYYSDSQFPPIDLSEREGQQPARASGICSSR